MPAKISSLTDRFSEFRRDCISSCGDQPDIYNKLGLKRIAVTGGTGFLGTWIAEMIAALNDEYDLKITLDLYARNISDWERRYPHLSDRAEIRLFSQDVRSPFQFQPETNFVIHAAGTPNNRVHASDPIRVVQTTVEGIGNALEAASQLDGLNRFINVSSGLVGGVANRIGAISEDSCFPIPSGQLHMIYADAKRSAESIAAIYRSQFRMPISTVRPFTLLGGYQGLDCPWAVNMFIEDAIKGRDIKIYGDGNSRRSYLYGSDAAWWLLVALIKGDDGEVYNLGGSISISHVDLAKRISCKANKRIKVNINALPGKEGILDEFYPNLESTYKKLGVSQTVCLDDGIDKAWIWYSSLHK